MKRPIYATLFFFILSFQTDKTPELDKGIYRPDPEGFNLNHPNLKISGRNFKIYDYGHVGRSYYGWGTYQINLKESIIKFNYEEIHGAFFYPLRNYIKTEVLIRNNEKLLMQNFAADKSEDTFRSFDSLYLQCKSSVDLSFENNIKRGRAKTIKKKDLKNNLY